MSDSQVSTAAPQFRDRKRRACREACELGDDRCCSNAFDFHAEDEHEQEIERDVRQVYDQDDIKWYPCVLQPDKPANERVVRQRCRRAPYAYREILAREFLYFRLGTEQDHRQLVERHLQQDQRQSNRCRNDQRLPERDPQAVIIISAETLCGDAGRSHAQKIHAAVQKSEYRGADCDRTQIDGALQMPGYAGIHHAEQRHRNIRQHHRGGDAPDITILR
jgi:hypothetical protein